MKKASNLIEISQVFDPQKVLTLKDKDLHQDIYESTIKPLKMKLLINQIPSKTFFICGQIGMGKSTALNYLPDDKINKKFDVKYLTGRELFAINDIDIIDILLMLGFELIKDTSLEDRYYEGLNKLKDINLETLKISKEQTWDFENDKEERKEIGAKLNLLVSKFDGKVFKNLKMNERERQSIREIFSIDKANLIDFINDIISDYKNEVMQKDKDLLLIIDDLEKISDKNIIKKVFVDDNWVFHKINCVKIIPIHIFLPRTYSMFNNDLIDFDFRIEANKLDKSELSKEEKAKIDTNINTLKNLIKARLIDEKFISEDAYTEIIKYSGGNIRQLIEIIYQASINQLTISDMEGTVITIEDVKWGVSEISNRLSKAADSKIRLLTQVAKHHKLFDVPTEKDLEDFDSLLLDNLIFFHKNGTHWYDVNPIIQKTVEVYAKSDNN
ncbi:hypothetical protein [Poseidonibacter antarcticus]|uniref:hypothetical protein n=1 Tax=Poseidonibacter antarcticus TaxID=2478538 RepID=UPI000EF49F25|nr:hypothetical protein [Poseidonibacter antarcticus]